MLRTLSRGTGASNWRNRQLPYVAGVLRLLGVAWFAPTLYYLLAVGGLGVTAKLALDDLRWHDLILWSGIGYIATAGLLLSLGQTSVRFVSGTPWAILSGVLAITGLIALYLALGSGEVGKVVSISAAYPVVTLLLAAAFLGEDISIAKGVGCLLVVGGVITLTLG